MQEPKYKMILTEEVPGYGPDWWIIYEADGNGNYIDNEVTRLPGNTKRQGAEAAKCLEWMNEVAKGGRRSAIVSQEDLLQYYKDKIANHREIGIPCFEQLG